ncbi:MAG: O-antigen ligase family protein [bacterium]|nr:O-antigen ligase family protein [bacterium]
MTAGSDTGPKRVTIWPRSVAAWMLNPPSARALWVQQMAAVCLIAAAVCVLGPLKAVAGVGALAVAMTLILGPSWFMLSVYLLFIICTHQYIFPFVIPFAGVEWQVRELILFVLLAHWTVAFLKGNVRVTFDMIHFAVGVVLLFFVVTALTGALRGNPMGYVIAESRNPLSLLSYVAFVALVPDRPTLHRYLKFILAITLITAAAATVFSLVATLSGSMLHLNQTAFGEITNKAFGPMRIQMFRPNGHELFEIAFVVLVSLFFSRATRGRQRFGILVMLLILSAGLMVGVMRTAYVVVLVSLLFLALFSLPSRLGQWMLAITGLSVALAILALFGSPLHVFVSRQLPGLDLSLQARMVEMSGAWRLFAEHPMLGAGFGSQFEALGLIQTGAMKASGVREYLTIHNTWMYWLFKGGVIGMAPLAAGLLAILAKGYYLIPRMRNSYNRALMRGLTAAFAGQLVGALAMPRFTYAKGFVLIALFAAAFYALPRKGSGGSPMGPDVAPGQGQPRPRRPQDLNDTSDP